MSGIGKPKPEGELRQQRDRRGASFNLREVSVLNRLICYHEPIQQLQREDPKTVAKLEEKVKRMFESTAPVTADGPPFDAATATGMYDP